MLNPNSSYQPLNTRKRQSPLSRRGCLTLLGGGLALLLVAFLIYQIPWVNDRLSWRIDELRARIVYLFNPPSEAIFVPQESGLVQVNTNTPNATTPSSTALELATPTITPTAIPGTVGLTGFKYVDQSGGWNLCGPASMAVALSYWGWEGTKYDVSNYVKPGPIGIDDFVERSRPDKNVMPYELEDFVDTQVPGLQAFYRVGGDLALIKSFIAAGFPVIVEKSSECPGPTWCGHYLFVTGYDDQQQEFTVQDVLLKEANLTESYDQFLAEWRGFNYLFFVIYPEERLDEVIQLLGPWNDEQWAQRHALELATQETTTLSDDAQFFAWFNKGSSHVGLYEYVDAAFAYDQAFQLYAGLAQDAKQPFRMMWYQTGPYWAYYHSGRYNDVINLANTTLHAMDEPTLEESIYWRGMAYLALGQTDNAIADFREAVRLNPNFGPGYAQLEALGVQP